MKYSVRKHKVKYKIGDKVKIKNDLNVNYIYREKINNLPDRVATIRCIVENKFYHLEELGDIWGDDEIECLVKKYESPTPILNRWEILDIR